MVTELIFSGDVAQKCGGVGQIYVIFVELDCVDKNSTGRIFRPVEFFLDA